MANNYYQSTNPDYGKMSISKYVFAQFAEETLHTLASTSLKNSISLALPKGKKLVDVSIQKDKIGVNIAISSIRGSNASQAVEQIQQEVYSDLYDAVEISSIRVNVEVAGFVDTPKKA